MATGFNDFPCGLYYPGFAPVGGGGLPDVDSGGGTDPPPPDDWVTVTPVPPADDQPPGKYPEDPDPVFRCKCEWAVFQCDCADFPSIDDVPPDYIYDTLAACLAVCVDTGGGGPDVEPIPPGILIAPKPLFFYKCQGNPTWECKGIWVTGPDDITPDMYEDLASCESACINPDDGFITVAPRVPVDDLGAGKVPVLVRMWKCQGAPDYDCVQEFIYSDEITPDHYETQGECLSICVDPGGGGGILVDSTDIRGNIGAGGFDNSNQGQGTTVDSTTTRNNRGVGGFNKDLDKGYFDSSIILLGEEHKRIWESKIRKGSAGLIYLGTNGKAIRLDGTNCPQGYSVKIDGDGCNYCSKEFNVTSVQRDLGNGQFKEVEGLPGYQGNCANGYVVEIENVEQQIKKCTSEGRCNPVDCLGESAENYQADFDLFESIGDYREGSFTNFRVEAKESITSVNQEINLDTTYNFFRTSLSPKYVKRPNSSVSFVSNLFGEGVDAGVDDAYRQFEEKVFNTTLIGDIDSNKLYKSLSPKIRDKFRTLRDSQGRPVSLKTSMYALKQYLFRGRIEDVQESELDEILEDQLPNSRILRNLAGYYPRREERISYVLDRMLPLDPKNKDLSLPQSKKIENLYIPPKELFESVTVLAADGTLARIEVENDLSYEVYDVTGGAQTDYLNYDHTYNVRESTGFDARLDTENNLAYTYQVLNIDSVRVQEWCKPHYSSLYPDKDYNFCLSVTSTLVDNVEYSYNLANPDFEDSIYLQLKPLTIEYEFDDSGIKTAKAIYDRILTPGGPIFHEEYVKRRMGPWLHINIDYNDPILEHLDNTGARIELKKNCIDFTTLGDTIDSNIGNVEIASFIPWFIIVTVTNKFSLTPAGTMSTLQSKNVRKLNLNYSNRLSMLRPGLSTPLKSSYAINEGEVSIQGVPDSQSIVFSYDEDAPIFSREVNYTEGTKPTTRVELGHRAVRELLDRLPLSYTLLNNEISNFEFYSRFVGKQFFTLGQGITETFDTIMNDIEEEEGIKIVNISAKEANKTRISKTIGVPIEPNTDTDGYPWNPYGDQGGAET